MRPTRDELQNFAYKTLVVIGALTLCVGISYAATTIGTNIVTDGSLYVGSLFGVATSSPGSLFSVGGVTNFTAATSTFYSSGGVNLSGGCFAVNGACVSGGSNSGGVISVTVPLSANDIHHLFSAPKTIIAAPGAGKAIVIETLWSVITAGTVAFDSETGDIDAYYGSSSGLSIGGPDSVFRSTTSKIGGQTGPGGSYAAVENLPVVIAGTGEDWVNGGAIAAAAVDTGGLGYAPGDTGYVDPQDTSTYVVDSVGAGGAVLTFHFSDPGYGNNVGNGYSTSVITGGGDGNFKINITAITPGNGSGSVTVDYQIVTLP